MWYVASFVLFVACVKFLSSGATPAATAGVFAAGKVVLALLLGGGISTLLVTAVITGAIAFVYFWVMRRFEDTGTWWIVLVAGVLLLA